MNVLNPLLSMFRARNSDLARTMNQWRHHEPAKAQTSEPVKRGHRNPSALWQFCFCGSAFSTCVPGLLHTYNYVFNSKTVTFLSGCFLILYIKSCTGYFLNRVFSHDRRKWVSEWYKNNFHLYLLVFKLLKKYSSDSDLFRNIDRIRLRILVNFQNVMWKSIHQ